MAHTTQWRARVAVDGIRATPSPGQYEELHQHIPGATGHDAATGRLTLTWRLTAGSLGRASEEALRAARAGLRAAGLGGDLAAVEVVSTAETAQPRAGSMDLLGHRDVAELLGVSPARVGQLRREHPQFPQPVAETSGGPVYTGESIRAFASRTRTAGRPRKDDAA